MSEVELSSSQEIQQVVDAGEMSFSVDKISEAVESPKPTKKEIPVDQNVESETTGAELPAGTEAEDIQTPGTDTEATPKGVEKRLAKMRRKQGDAERRAEAAELKVQELKQELEQSKTINIGKSPNIDDFETEEAFYEALTDYKINVKFAEQNKKALEQSKEQAKSRAEEVEQARQESIKTSFNEASKKYTDFDVTIKDVQVSDAVIDSLASIDNSGDVAYLIGKNKTLADKLSILSVIDTAIEIQKLSEQVRNRKISNAPAPIIPLSSKKGAVKTLENMSMSEYSEHRKKQGAI